MTARLFLSPDAAAPSWQNVPTAPGSTEQSRNRTEEPQMVDTTVLVREVAAVAYTPAELNRLISREIAGRLREVADLFLAGAGYLADATRPNASIRASVYRDVALQLHERAEAELIGIGDGQVDQ